MDPSISSESRHDREKRKLLVLAASAMAVTGVAGFAWVLGDSLSPAADVTRRDAFFVGDLREGEFRMVAWRRTSVIIHRRTPSQIELARLTAKSAKFPEAEELRSPNSSWFVGVGICTYRGCLLAERPGHPQRIGRKGWYWFCPCCGSEFDFSGRAMIGPAPRNLDLPAYTFDEAGTLWLG